MEERLMIRQGLVHDAVHREPYLADILVEGGKIRKIAPTLDAEMIDQTKLLDVKGLQVYPGFVEAHCHLGLDGYGIGFEGADYNEVTDSLTPELSAVDGINPQDESIRLAMEGGVTCVAAGEDILKRPPYDPKLEALIPVIRGEMPLKAHVHQANDIYTAIRIAKEFDTALQLDHCTDGSLIADDLAKEGYPLAVGPLLGHATKFELKNKSFATPGDLARAGCQVSIITDSPVIPQQYLALCAGLAVNSGMDAFEALRAITIHAAKHIGVEARVGSLEIGKDADFVIAAGNPMISDTKIKYVLIDGRVTYARHD